MKFLSYILLVAMTVVTASTASEWLSTVTSITYNHILPFSIIGFVLLLNPITKALKQPEPGEILVQPPDNKLVGTRGVVRIIATCPDNMVIVSFSPQGISSTRYFWWTNEILGEIPLGTQYYATIGTDGDPEQGNFEYIFYNISDTP